MELHQLEAFSAVMSVGSITGAGRLLDRSQPAVTRQIQELEANLGYVLFDRNGPRVTPTHEAFLLHEEVERSLVGLQAIEQRARAIGQGAARPLSIAATPSLASSIIPDALARVLAQAADAVTTTPVQLRTQSAEHVVHAVLTHQADIGLVTLPIGHGGLDVHWIASAPCVAAVAAASPLAQQPVVALQDLAGKRLATVANRHRLRHRIDSALQQAGVKASVWLETNNSLNALMTARSGAAIAIVDPASAVGLAGPALAVRPLDAAIPFLFGLVTCAGRPRHVVVDRLLQAIRDSTLALMDGVVMHAAHEHDALLQLIANTGSGKRAPSEKKTSLTRIKKGLS